MLYDIDGDGTNDVGVVDKNGNLFWIRVGEHGQYLEDYHIQVPKLKIMRNWHTGLDPVFVDNYILTAMFDHKSNDRGKQYGYGTGTEKPLFSKSKDDPVDAAAAKKIKPDALGFRVQQDTYPELYKYADAKAASAQAAPIHGRRLLSVEDSEEQANIPSEPQNLDGNSAQVRTDAVSSSVAVASKIMEDAKPLESVVEKKEESVVEKPNDVKPLESVVEKKEESQAEAVQPLESVVEKKEESVVEKPNDVKPLESVVEKKEESVVEKPNDVQPLESIVEKKEESQAEAVQSLESVVEKKEESVVEKPNDVKPLESVVEKKEESVVEKPNDVQPLESIVEKKEESQAEAVQPLESVVEKKEESVVEKPNDVKPLENVESDRVVPAIVTDPTITKQEEITTDKISEEVPQQKEVQKEAQKEELDSGSGDLEGPEFRPEDELKDDYVPP
jgi:flagellar biosynthesis chaperone FliJ